MLYGTILASSAFMLERSASDTLDMAHCSTSICGCCGVRHRIQRIFVTTLVDERAEHALLVLEKLARRSELGLMINVSDVSEQKTNKTHDMASIKHKLHIHVSRRFADDVLITHDFVSIHDGLQAMRNGEDSDILAKLLPQGGLDDGVGLIICTAVLRCWNIGKLSKRDLTDSGSG